MNGSEGLVLLEEAAGERSRLRRHLLVAAALRDLLSREPVVVGGTAQEYWSQADYHETDLDLCVPLGPAGRDALGRAGFVREGRHWVHGRIAVAVEFPDSRIDGDRERTVLVAVGSGWARIIGAEDLYLDRLRQATATEEQQGDSFHSALAIAVARYNDIDWDYVRSRLSGIEDEEPLVGRSMRRLQRTIRTRARRILTDPRPGG